MRNIKNMRDYKSHQDSSNSEKPMQELPVVVWGEGEPEE